MKKLVAILMAITAGVAGGLFTQADEPQTVVTDAPLPSPVRRAIDSVNARSSDSTTKVEHLRQAADHLEAAGQVELAEKIRGEADELHAKSVQRLQELEKQLAAIQKEIQTLRSVTGKPSQILLQCRILEVSPQTLTSLGKELAGKYAGTSSDWKIDSGQPGVSVISEVGLNQRLDTLISEGKAKSIAEPAIVAADGRPADLINGGEFPIVIPSGSDQKAVEWRQFGTRIQFVPHLLGAGRVRLEMSPEVTHRDFSQTVSIDGVQVPGLVCFKLNTQVDLELGHTIIAAMSHGRSTESEKVVLVVVTPEMVEPPEIVE